MQMGNLRFNLASSLLPCYTLLAYKSPMKTILLAGGQSKRMDPIDDKSFVKICGRTLIEWQLMSLRSAGFSDIVIVGSHFNLPRLQQMQMEGMQIQVVEQVDLSGGMKAAKTKT